MTSARSASRAASMILPLLLSLGCEDQLTQLLIAVDTDLSVPDEISRVRVSVTGFGSQPLVSADLEDTPLPVTVALLHEAGPLGPVTVEASGYRLSHHVVAQVKAGVFFFPGEARVLQMRLLDQCIGVVCAEDETCAPEGCRPSAVDASELLPWEGPPPRYLDVDTSVPEDAGADGSVDAEPDAPDSAASCSVDRPCYCTEGSCAFGCARGSCEAHCSVRSECTFDGDNVSDMRLHCRDDASCSVDVSVAWDADTFCDDRSSCEMTCGRVDNCQLHCRGGASCLLRCMQRDARSCSIIGCGGGRSCGDGVYVCNRRCP